MLTQYDLVIFYLNYLKAREMFEKGCNQHIEQIKLTFVLH